MVQWLRLCASTAGGVGSVPGQGTKTPTCHMTWPKKKKRNFDFLSISVLELSVLCLVKSLFFSKVITASMDMSLSKLWGMVKDREAQVVAVPRVTESQTRLSYWTNNKNNKLLPKPKIKHLFLWSCPRISLLILLHPHHHHVTVLESKYSRSIQVPIPPK